MVNPQKEQGFTPIANELLEAFYKCKLTEYERCVVMCLWRKTYGWQKKEDWVSNSQIQEETGIALPNITRTLKSLKKKNVVKKDTNRSRVNKMYGEWIVEWRIVPDRLSHQITQVISPDNQKLSLQIPTKEKRNYTKTKSEPNGSAQSDLPNKEENMWNTTSDDFADEVSIDLDGDGTLEEKKPQTRKYPNAPAVRKVFQEVLGKSPAAWKVNKNQLLACENLYTERGMKAIRNALLFSKEYKDKEYCPQISSPYDLDSKWTKLGEFKKSLS